MAEPLRCRVCGSAVNVCADGTAGRHTAAGRNVTRYGTACPGTGHPPAGEPPCLPTCIPVGTIGWPVPIVRGEAHASAVVCDSPSHQDETRAWVHSITGHAGVFRTFEEARAGQ